MCFNVTTSLQISKFSSHADLMDWFVFLQAEELKPNQWKENMLFIAKVRYLSFMMNHFLYEGFHQKKIFVKN